ncbi:MAG TPA: TOBE domain-containing protein, partial [Gammaproteobacteria bacterium]|nr:TOBE domain-containing protein [Gammaproteobacteria bacterium]
KADADATLTGTLHNIVYFGTDTHYHLRLPDDTPFIVRAQNKRGAHAQENYQKGAQLGVQIADQAVQILRD